MPVFDKPITDYDLAPEQDYETVPDGWYALLMTAESKVKATKSGDGAGYTVEFTIAEGQFKGKTISHWFCVHHNKEWIQNRSDNQIKMIARACNKQPRALSELFSIKFFAYVSQAENEYTGKDGKPKKGTQNRFCPGKSDEQIKSVREYKKDGSLQTAVGSSQTADDSKSENCRLKSDNDEAQ